MKTIKSGNKYYRATEIPDEITEGWVIVNASGMIIDFTFSRTREAAINKWLELWTKPKNWHTHQCAYGACDVEHVLLPGDVVEKREMAGNVIKGVLDFTIDENKISWHIDDGGDDSLIVRDFDALKKSV